MAYEATEHGYLKISNRKVVGMRPQRYEYTTTVLPPTEIGTVLARLGMEGWRLSSDNKLTGNEFGDYELKIERRIIHEPPTSTAEYEFSMVRLEGAEPLEDVQHRFEVMGFDLIQILTPMNAPLCIIFGRPKGARSVEAATGN